jgi:hypothetical protein
MSLSGDRVSERRVVQFDFSNAPGSDFDSFLIEKHFSLQPNSWAVISDKL